MGAAAELATISLLRRARRRLVGIVCRFTVGQDLVGTSFAEGERESPQRARVVRAAAYRASPVRLLVVARGHV